MLRTGIDNLRRERLVFDDIHRKLAKSLLVKKKEMAGVIAHTNHILESREKVTPLHSFDVLCFTFALPAQSAA